MPSEHALVPALSRPGAISLVAQGGPNGYQYPSYEASCDACLNQSIVGCTAEKCGSMEVSGADIHADNGVWCYCAPAAGLVCGAGEAFNCYPSPSPPPSPHRTGAAAEAVLASANSSASADSSTSASSPAPAPDSGSAAATSTSPSVSEWASAKAGEIGRAVERSMDSLSAALGNARTQSPGDEARVSGSVRLLNVALRNV